MCYFLVSLRSFQRKLSIKGSQMGTLKKAAVALYNDQDMTANHILRYKDVDLGGCYVDVCDPADINSNQLMLLPVTG